MTVINPFLQQKQASNMMGVNTVPQTGGFSTVAPGALDGSQNNPLGGPLGMDMLPPSQAQIPLVGAPAGAPANTGFGQLGAFSQQALGLAGLPPGGGTQPQTMQPPELQPSLGGFTPSQGGFIPPNNGGFTPPYNGYGGFTPPIMGGYQTPPTQAPIGLESLNTSPYGKAPTHGQPVRPGLLL